MGNKEKEEGKTKKIKFNNLFEFSNNKENTWEKGCFSIKKNNIFSIPKELIERKRPLKTYSVVKEQFIKPDESLVKNLQSTDPLALHDLYHVLSKTDITEEITDIVVRKCKKTIFRKITNTTPTGVLYHPSDDNNIKNKPASNINIFCKILELITRKCTSTKILKSVLSDLDIISMYELLKSEDEKERAYICSSIINIYNVFESKIKNLLTNELILFYERNRTHIGVEELLCISQNTLNTCRDDVFYSQMILKFLHCKNLNFYKVIVEIILKYCSADLQVSEYTLKYIYKVYEKTEYLNKVLLVELYFEVYIMWKKKIPFSNVLDNICNIINLGFASNFSILIEEIIKLTSTRIIKTTFESFVNEILPKIFTNLYKLSKKHWDVRSKSKIYGYISLWLRINHKCFERCLIDYNKAKYYNELDNNIETYDNFEENESILDVIKKCLNFSETNFNIKTKKNH